MKETLKYLKNNQLVEIFGTGTACVVCPIDTILYKNTPIALPTMTSGAILMNRLAKELNDIHYGKVQGPQNWSVVID
jgi:branched-chain amino acid aminotransferase